jgi:succinate-semialdehyde dehydrogenase / glutarate-semialdehyde dehydrogenase
MAIRSLNPATGELLRSFEPFTDKQVDACIERAQETFVSYRHTPFASRAKCMMRAGEILEAEKPSLGRTMTLEMGKTLRSAIQEVEKCAFACRFYAEHAEKLLLDESAPSGATRSFIKYQPLGIVLAVMPWNFPLWQVFRFAAPGLMAGNVGLLKHASNVPQCALAIEDVFRRAGFPEGAFQTLLIGSAAVERVIADPRVKAVTLTGSVPAGSKVAEAAGKQIKKTVLELGGSDPFIVMPSANLDEAAKTAVQARVINNGQSCIAAKRFIVAAPVADEFEKLFVKYMSALRVGDPMKEDTDVGPQATEDGVKDLDDQVKKSVAKGAKVLIGGKRLDGPGFFYAPTALTNIPKDAPAYYDEMFGPVASIFRARDAKEAIAIANDSCFGLGASAWTEDAKERELFIDGIDSGLVFINGMVASDPRLPFGGVKQSGYGRELSAFGIREFTNIKTVAIYGKAGENRSETE